MHRVLVIVFDNETEADKGKTELLQLDSEGSIGIYGYAVVAKKADGTVASKQADGRGTLSPFAGSLLGSLDGSMGPTPESTATQASNSAADSNKTRTGEKFIRDVMEVLVPNRVAIVAEVEETWTPVLDTRMESIGGVVFRWTVSEVQHAVDI
jgi:uncharacterized membrane protein